MPKEKGKTYLREGTVVPDITLVGETVTNKSKLTLLGILDNRVHSDFLGDLFKKLKLIYWPRVQVCIFCCFCLYVTSSLALDQRGISTTMLRMVFSALAKRGISWKGETGTPFFSILKVFNNVGFLHMFTQQKLTKVETIFKSVESTNLTGSNIRHY